MPPNLTNASANPFRKTHSPLAGKPAGKLKAWHAGLIGWLVAAALVGALCGTFLFARLGHGLPRFMPALVFLQMGDGEIFSPAGGMERQEARKRYAKGLAALQENDFDTALSDFKALEPAYPGLRDYLLLHQAEAYAGQGNEWAVQKKLAELLAGFAQSPLRALAQYRLAQSHYRATEREKAAAAFEKTRADFPRSEEAIGSLYYLGKLKLAGTPRDPAGAAEAFGAYLDRCPDCRFSGEAAHELDQLQPHPDARGHLRIGLGYGHAGLNSAKAISYLRQAPLSESWLLRGQLELRNGQVPAGVQTLMDGIGYAKTTEDVQQAVDWIARYAPANQRMAKLNALKDRHLPVGGDYVLWKLSQLNPGQAQAYYQAILNSYPDGDYAPESGWLRLWPLLEKGERTAYLREAQLYLSRYPYGKAAPKALFWMAKCLEAGNPAEATRAYEHVLSHYPESYYAFRASGRLNVLARGQADPGWRLDAQTAYPPRVDEEMTAGILPPADTLGGDGQRARLAELVAIGAPQDVADGLIGLAGEVPPAVKSWQQQLAGDRAQGIRTIRDALEKQDRERRKQDPQGKPPERAAALRLLYPVYFEGEIARQASRQGLDPYLVQSLMREESYFNELAVSSSNAYGLMQLLPSTAREVAGWEGMAGFKPTDLFVPAVNVRLGTRYLGHLHQIFNRNGMLAVGSYNGGPGAMKRWAATSPYLGSDPDMFVERIPYAQTRDYIKKVYGSYWNYHRLYGNLARQPN